MSTWEDVPSDWEPADPADPVGEDPALGHEQPGHEQPGYEPAYEDAGMFPAPATPHATAPGGWDYDEDTPFGGVEQVDGLVYTPDEISPELQWSNQPVNVPPPPTREAPQMQTPQFAEPWKPGPDPAPATPAATSGMVRLLAVTVVPLLILAGLGLLVLRVMDAYGF